MRELFECHDIDYYGERVPTGRLALSVSDGHDALLVKPFDPVALDALVRLGIELGWNFELIGPDLVKKIRFTKPAEK